MEHKPSYSDSLRADILPSYSDSLMHHGIKGQKWGVRRFQNPDGSLTPEGRARYNKNYKKAYDAVTKNHLFSLRRYPERTGLIGTVMGREMSDKVANTPAYFRANQVGYPKEYLQSTTKKERNAEKELAIKICKNERHDIFTDCLDKYSNILAKEFGLDINKLGVKDALQQALLDKGYVNKDYVQGALNYKPDRSLPKNYHFKGLGDDYYKWRNKNKKALSNIDYTSSIYSDKVPSIDVTPM